MTVTELELKKQAEQMNRKHLIAMVKYAFELKKIGIVDGLKQMEKDKIRGDKDIDIELGRIRAILSDFLEGKEVDKFAKSYFPNGDYTAYRNEILNKNFLDELNIRIGKGEIKLEQLQEIIKRYGEN
jgi:hypothetical protein